MKKRDAVTIKYRLAKMGLTQAEIAKRLGYPHPARIYDVVNGRVHTRRVLRYLLDLGIPPRLLALPEDMRDQV